MTLLDAGTPLEPSTMRKIIAENLFDGVLLGYILKHWERCETRVGWEVVVDMMVSFQVVAGEDFPSFVFVFSAILFQLVNHSVP